MAEILTPHTTEHIIIIIIIAIIIIMRFCSAVVSVPGNESVDSSLMPDEGSKSTPHPCGLKFDAT